MMALLKNQYLTNTLILASFLTGLMGFATIFSTGSVSEQLNTLLHITIGIASSIALPVYIVSHFRKSVGYRRIYVLLSGLTTIPLFLAFLFSGWHILIIGALENKSWIPTLHTYSGILFALSIAIHITLHYVTGNRTNKKSNKVSETGNSTASNYLPYMLSACVIATLLSTVLILSNNSPGDFKSVENYQLDTYGDNPFAPSETTTDGMQFINHHKMNNSTFCVSCHEDISRQWFSSMHRLAASDPAYEKNIALLVENKGIAAARYCEGCHAPIALLSGDLTEGGKHGGIDNTDANHEGISCVSCHNVSKINHTKGVASYHFTPRKAYLFEGSEFVLAQSLEKKLIEISPEQHKRDMGRPLLKSAEFCATCHAQFMDKNINNWGWVKMQDEYTAWLESPYSGQKHDNFAAQTQTTCIDCHMPLVESNDPSSNENGKVRSHDFAAANTIIPLLEGDTEQYQRVLSFLKSNKMRVSIELPERTDLPQSLLTLDENLRTSDEISHFYYAGEEAEINVVIANIGVGHDFPAGTIDLGEAWVEFAAYDAEGTVIYVSGKPDPKSEVEKGSHVYKSITVDRQGNEVWKHDLFNMVGEAFKRTISAGESDIAQYNFDIPYWAKSPITIVSNLHYRKLNLKYARWALDNPDIEVPIVTMASDTITLPVFKRQRVESN